MEKLQERISGTPSAALFQAALQIDLMAWIMARRPEVRSGIPYDLETDPWMVDLYETDSQVKVIMKAAQVRMSEFILSEAFWKMTTQGWSVFYAFPTDTKSQRFVKSRVSPALSSSPYLKELLGTDDVSIKTLGAAAIFFSGAQKPDQITSDAVDMVIRDEYELIPEETKPLLEARFENSPHKFLRDLSHPRFPNMGISQRFMESDQREWEVPCPHCGRWQEMTWDRVQFTEETARACDLRMPVDPGSVWLACGHCGKALDRLANGRWAAKNPQSGIPGWHVSRLMSFRADLAELVRRSRNGSEFERQAFYNMDLGIPYSPKGVNVNRSILDSCVSKDYHLPGGADLTWMGVDIGVKIHVWIERRLKGQIFPVFYGSVDNFDDLDPLLPRYGVALVVMDALPETREARRWVLRHHRRALLAFFSTGARTGDAEMIRFDQAKAQVLIHRTMACDEVEQEFTQRRVVLPAEAPVHPELFRHIESMTRVRDKSPSGEPRVSWVETAPNHLWMAKLYSSVAYQIFRLHGYGGGQTDPVREDNSGSLDEDREFSPRGDWI